MCLTKERKKLKKSPGYRLRGMRIMMFSVDAENGEKTEMCSSIALFELVEVTHDELRLTMCGRVIFEFSKSGLLLHCF